MPAARPTRRICRVALVGLGVAPDRIYLNHGLTGWNRDRPGKARARRGHNMAPKKANSLIRQAAFENTLL